MKLHEFIKEKIRKKGTQAQAARFTGISKQHLNMILAGSAIVSTGSLRKISEYLGYNVEEKIIFTKGEKTIEFRI